MRWLLSFFLLTGCSLPRGPEREQAMAAVSVAIAEATCDVTLWTGNLPLVSTDTESTPPMALAIEGKPTAIPWRKDFRTAVIEAGKTQRPLLAHVVSDNCAPCAQLKKTTFVDPVFIEAISAGFVVVEVNQSKNPGIVKSLNVRRFPTDVLILVRGSRWRIIDVRGAPETTQLYLSRLKAFAKLAIQPKEK